MKFTVYALLALMLSACASFNPVVSVDVTPEPTYEPAAVATAPTPEAAPEPALVVKQTAELAFPVEVGPPALNAAELECMALTLYHEARGESEAGMLGVGYVVMNRVKTRHLDSTTICQVVHKGPAVNGQLVRNRCQFNWACDGRSDKPTETAAYERAVLTAEKVMRGEARNPVGASLYFHEARITWRYASSFTRIARIGNHIFYA